MLREFVRVATCAAILAGLAASATAVPLSIPYFGHLTFEATGAPYDGSVTVSARLYTAAAAGTLVWSSEALPSVQVASGSLTFVLEGGTPDLGTVDFDAAALWLEIELGAETMAPRQRLASVP